MKCHPSFPFSLFSSSSCPLSQVEDVNRKFGALSEAESRGWQEEHKPPPRQKKLVKVRRRLVGVLKETYVFMLKDFNC